MSDEPPEEGVVVEAGSMAFISRGIQPRRRSSRVGRATRLRRAACHCAFAGAGRVHGRRQTRRSGPSFLSSRGRSGSRAATKRPREACGGRLIPPVSCSRGVSLCSRSRCQRPIPGTLTWRAGGPLFPASTRRRLLRGAPPFFCLCGLCRMAWPARRATSGEQAVAFLPRAPPLFYARPEAPDVRYVSISGCQGLAQGFAPQH